jgi:plasmid stability protein
MSTSITLKNIPEPLYRRIRIAADRHHRSLNSEILARLEQALAPHPVDVEESLQHARRLRERYTGPPLTIDDIQAAIDQGRR